MDHKHQASVTQPAAIGQQTEPGLGFIDAAREATGGYVERRKNDVAQAVADLATSIRQTAAGVERRSNIHAIVEAAVEGIDDLSARIRSRPAPGWATEMETLVKRHPTAVAALAASAGLLIAGLIVRRYRHDSVATGPAPRRRAVEEPRSAGSDTSRQDQPPPSPLTTAPPAQPPLMTDPDLGVPPRY